MEQLIAWIILFLLVVFIIKVGSFIWRTVGILVILFLLWIFRDEIFSQINHFVQNFSGDQFSDIMNQVGDFLQGLLKNAADWFKNLVN